MPLKITAKLRLQTALALLAETIKNHNEFVQQNFLSTTQLIHQQTAKIEDVQTMIRSVFSGGVPVRLSADFTQNDSQVADGDRLPNQAPQVPNLQNSIQASYRMSCNISTVVDVWREYSEGIFGGPALHRLEEQFGTSGGEVTTDFSDADSPSSTRSNA